MKTNELSEKEAVTLSEIITAAAEVLSGLAVIEIAAGIRQDQGIQKIAGEGLRAAHKIDVKLESMLRAGGWEIRQTSPMVRSLVRVGTGLHDSLKHAPKIGSHVGAVGEGSMPEKESLIVTEMRETLERINPKVQKTVQINYLKPVTGKNKPVTKKLDRKK